MSRMLASPAGLLLGVVGSLSAAMAQQLPTWSIAEICVKEPAQCAAFEGRAREAVSGGWGVLPEAYRTACLAEIKVPADRSWRILSQCLEQQVLKGLDRKAVATSVTPSPAEPAAQQAPVPDPTRAPPPPFVVPATPPSAN